MYSLGWVGVYSMLCVGVGGRVGEISRRSGACGRGEEETASESGLYNGGRTVGRTMGRTAMENTSESG
jgi:hypothetical protein